MIPEVASDVKFDVSLLMLYKKYGHDPRFLIAQRRSGFLKGSYTFIGGKRFEGETIEDCAVREAYEETGLRITINQLNRVDPFAIKIMGKSETPMRIFMFLCEYQKSMGIPKQRERTKQGAWEWRSLTSICRLIAQAYLHPLILYDGYLEYSVGYDRSRLDQRTNQIIKEVQYYMAVPADIWLASPEATRALTLI